MRRRLSSHQTVLVKIILPVVWPIIFGLGVINMFTSIVDGPNASVKLLFLMFWIAGSVFIWWGSVRLKVVSVDQSFLYVSNYLKEIAIPLSDIYEVTENVWLNSHPVTIHLKHPSEFGDKVVFMPKTRPFGFFSSHPVVAELKGMARGSLR